jgi:hypothetical protein
MKRALSFNTSLPPLRKRGIEGDFIENIIRKSPLTSLCQRGEPRGTPAYIYRKKILIKLSY